MIVRPKHRSAPTPRWRERKIRNVAEEEDAGGGAGMRFRRRSSPRAATEMLATKLIAYEQLGDGSRRAALPRALYEGLAAIVATCIPWVSNNCIMK